VEVKIGVQFAPRELVVESAQSPADVAKAVSDALASESGVLNLVDEKGRRVHVPVAKLAYVEIASPPPGRSASPSANCSDRPRPSRGMGGREAFEQRGHPSMSPNRRR